MTDLRELYQETILDHYRKPRNSGRLADSNRMAEGFNPLCGDRVKLYLKVEDGVIRNVRFEGIGCAIATASASLMTESIKGKREDEALQLLETIHNMVTGGTTTGDSGKLEVLAGVHEFPERVKCATLAWHTLKAALENIDKPVTTE
ncbi:Fe-S cluster assembly sulfur transfer protein SufU [Sideroxydans sp. CL21]|jgi:nitrogen fixation NifU-like protein|uniref:Fe-S cluster assembly sulfur transfer protein SufU n=1 Tax=Sideroxydans sp. CL21 TaxID=2600596 RepID=UPI0012A9260E|nr:SUF system NifU family Fe-S cluster assembly protein [Sideroxydans sp. CL21]VVC83991.1 Putative iron-sulfur cluster assembly scaffold protein for SUF system, SufE2 [Sideroxydans sp. CL21]